MLNSALTGLIAAVLVAIPEILHAKLPGFPWFSPWLVLGVAAIAVLLQRRFLRKKSRENDYNGLADLLIHIHSPAGADSSIRWLIHGVVSFLLFTFGGVVGSEGAAVELTHALVMRVRTRSSRWFEQKRRTDAGLTLSAGVAAAFGAPFAGVLLPIEMGIGGRTISSASSALVAFLAMKWIMKAASLGSLSFEGALAGFQLGAWQTWVSVVVIAALAGGVVAGLIRFFRFTADGLGRLFEPRFGNAKWAILLSAAALIVLLGVIHPGGFRSSPEILEGALWSKWSSGSIALMFFTHFVLLALVLAGFGTVGVFWPIFALGGLFGLSVDHFLLGELAGTTAAAGLAGAAAFWGAMLGAPLSASVAVLEMTQNPYILLPCLVSGLLAREIRARLKVPTLVNRDLESRGVMLLQGRSASILDAIAVREAMVTDHETVHEHEPVSQLFDRLLKSRYPFLPVVNSQGFYTGTLTIDMIQDGWNAQKAVPGDSPLSKLLEAKDLLYRSGFKSPTVRAGDRLSVTTGLFEDVPCVPVLNEESRVVGLLFVYHVRLAYDREVAKRSIMDGN